MSIFNPEALKNVVIEGANSTEAIPFPVMDSVVAVVKSYNIEGLKDKVLLTVVWSCSDQEVAEVTGREENIIRQKIWLDINEAGNLDMRRGANVGLGKLREALDQNSPTESWSFGMIVGQVAKIRTSQRVGDDGATYADVKAVFSINYTNGEVDE